MTVLLDGPVLAALVIAEHEHHDRAARWIASVDSFAITPVTEAAVLRFLLRLGESPQTGLAVLSGIRQHPKCAFWPSALSFTEIPAEHLDTADQLSQHYLIALASARGDRVATLDEGLATRFAETTTLLPA